MIWSNIMQILKSNSKARFEIYYYANFKHHWIWENMSLHRKRHLRISKHDCKTFQNITFSWKYIRLRRRRKIFFQNVTHDAHKEDAVDLGMHIIAISVNSLRIILFIWQGLILFYSMSLFNCAENGLCRFVVFCEMCSKILR